MNREPIKISRDDLMSEGVEGRLREQSTVRSTKDHYERANVVTPQIATVVGWRAWLLRSIVYLSLFGLLGGAVGAVAGEMFAQRPDRAEEAAQLMADLKRIDRAELAGRYAPEEAQRVRARVREIGQRNTLFVTADASAHGDAAKLVGTNGRALAAAMEADREATTRANLLVFAAAGLLIAAALAAADRLTERDLRGALIHGSIAGAIGVAAGAGAAHLMQTTSSALVFALFSGFVGAAPGVVLRSVRRTGAGIGGGVIGGLIAAAVIAALLRWDAGELAAHALGFSCLGLAIGLAMGWREDATKQGWLRVASGLIAGKQFILYRNPTFVGSAPMSHIYLFRDPQVGRRHAAIFQVTGGYEIENLPLGGPTLVNGQPVSRVRLKRGDQIGVGRTTLIFDEKVGA